MNNVEQLKSANTEATELLWYTLSQNNSGGLFIINDVVDQYVLIQARSKKEFEQIARSITEPYSSYCECCGERWSIEYADDGTVEPEIYNESVYTINRQSYRERAILHFYDGRVERVTFA